MITTYPLGDRIPGDHSVRIFPTSGVKAVKTGQFRPPLRGEWYLSGAIPHAYIASNNLSHPYHIMKLVRVKVVTTEIVEEYP